jgi:hypothetical protein
MKKKKLRFGESFRVVPGNRDSQHRGALLKTLNFYVPPAYKPSGDPLPRGKQ